MLPGLSAKRRKVSRQSEICECERAENKKGEEGGETIEQWKQWKSKRRKSVRGIFFIKKKKGHAHLSKRSKNEI